MNTTNSSLSREKLVPKQKISNTNSKTMNKYILRIALVFALAMVWGQSWGQTGPGGVGNKDGSNGQPKNIMWYNAGSIALVDNTDILTWTDISGNANNATQPSSSQQPKFRTGQINGLPAVVFDPTGTTGNEDFMPLNGSLLTAKDFTIITVARRRSDGARKYIFGGTNSGTNNNLHVFWGNATTFEANLYGNILSTAMVAGGGTTANTFGIFTTRLASTEPNPQRKNYQNNNYLGGLNNNGQLNSWSGAAMARNAFNDTPTYSDVDIAELIVFSTALNAAQLEIVHNYLNEKYGITINNDRYTAPSGYTTNMVGIGNLGGEKQSRTNCSGLYLYEDNGSLGNGEYIFSSHNNATNDLASVLTTGIGTAQRAWNRAWYISRNGTAAADVKLIFDFPEAFTLGKYPVNVSNYVLLYKATAGGTYSVVSGLTNGLEAADQVYFKLPPASLLNGYYTIGTLDQTNSPIQGSSSRTWYALKSGNWDDWNTWTLDPSGNLPNNDLHELPVSSDKVVIHSGKTIDIALFHVGIPGEDNTGFVNGKIIAQITVEGRLNLNATTGHNFTIIRGNGRIFLSADNFPLGDATHFVTKGQGEGTVVYEGTGYNLNTARTFYNMVVNLTNNTDIVALNANYQINGDLTVTKGFLQFNDNTNNRTINLDVDRDVLVEANGKITVGNGNPILAAGYSIQGTMPALGLYHSIYHQFLIGRNLTNNGTIRMTNQTAPDYNHFTTTGAVTVTFDRAENAIALLNGTSDFYNLIINKGTDKTYILDLSPSNTTYFTLFGPNSVGRNEGAGFPAANPEIRKALWIRNGTLKLTGSTNIPTLSEGADVGGNGDYAIGQTARLWIAGASVSVYSTASLASQVPASSVGVNTGTSNQALSVYGEYRISDGFFGTRNSAGFIFWSASDAQIKIDGGTTNIAQFRAAGTGGVPSYIQTNGTLIVRGHATEAGEIDGSRPLFGFDDPSGVFSMSNGEIIMRDIAGSNTNGFYVPVAAGNYNVSGGKLTIETASGNDFEIGSTAPLWNLEIKRLSGGATTLVRLTNTLKVLRDLTINANCLLDAQDDNTGTPVYDLKIGQNFYVKNGGSYNARTNTTWFTESQNSNVDIENTATADYLQLNNVRISKNPQSNLSLFYGVQFISAGRSTNPAVAANSLAIINGNLYIERGELNTNTFKVSVKGNIEIVDGQILAATTTPGRLVLNGTVMQTITGAINKEQAFGSLELSNSAATAPTPSARLLSNINVTNFYLNRGVMDLDVFNLQIQGTASTTGTYGTSLMFQTAGNSTDGGLSLYVNANGTYFYPLGTNANSVVRYTPTNMVISSYNDDGYVQVRMADESLPMAEGPGSDVLSYYWRIYQSGFTTRPNAVYTFYAADSDDPSGLGGSLGIASQVPGEILEESPYTRSNVSGAVNWPVNLAFSTNTRSLKNAYYTVGKTTSFNQTLLVFYNRLANGNWNDRDTWSNTDHKGARAGGGGEGSSYPGPYDIVKIAGKDENGVDIDNVHININNARCAQLTFEQLGGALSSLYIDGNNAAITAVNLGRVTGVSGRIHVTLDGSRASQVALNGDYTEFVRESTNEFVYINNSNSPVTLPNQIDEFPMLRLTTETGTAGLNNFTFPMDIIVNNRMMVHGYVNVDHNITLNSGTLYVMNSDPWAAGRTGHLIFNANRSSKVYIKGDLSLAREGRIYCLNNSGSSDLTQNIELTGNLNMESTSALDLYNNVGTRLNMVNLTLSGVNDGSMTNTGTGTVEFYRIIMNKLLTKNFTFNNAFSLSGPANSDPKALELTSGNLFLNHAGINLTLSSGGANFKIPKETSLSATSATLNVSGDNTGIWLDGLMSVGNSSQWLINGGNNNYIEYTDSKSSNINVTGGALTVGSQIRRQTNTEEGVLVYNQSGGAVIVGQKSAPENTRGVFEILNAGSIFTHSAGSFTIVRQQTNPTIASFYFAPITAVLSPGTTITIGNTSTPPSQNIGLYIKNTIRNLTIAGSNNPTATLLTVPLTLDNLTINASNTFNANGLQLNVNENFTNNGIFTHTNNLTVFGGTVDQQITGASKSTFWQLTKTSTTNLTLGSNIQVDDDLSLEGGTFADNSHDLLLLGDLYSVATHAYGGTGDGITFGGTLLQNIIGNGTFGKLTLNNIYGVKVNDGYSLVINNALKLVQGVFDIGSNLLTMSENASFIEQNPFSVTNMVQTYKSITDSGIKKKLNSGIITYTYPIGSNGKYTPVILTIGQNGSSNGALTVKAVDETHPTIQPDLETPDYEIVDASNALKYYWSLKAENFTDFIGNVELKYAAEDVKIANANGSAYTIADYIPARLLYGQTTWNKFDWSNFDEGNQRIIFRFTTAVTNSEISGDYTAGIQPNTASAHGAIPDQVPAFISATSGNWTNPLTWYTYPLATTPVAGQNVPTGGPRGAVVIIESVHIVTMDQNYLSSYSTEIRGKLIHGTTYGNRVGIVSGSGTLSTSTEIIPAGYYADFLSTSGGTLEYAGSGDIDILNNIASLNNLIVSGTGQRRCPNLDFTVQGNLTINGIDATLKFKNEHSRKMTVNRDIIFNGGEFIAGTGVSSIVQMGGTSAQFIRRTSGSNNFTATNAFNHFIVDNISGVTLQIPIDIGQSLKFLDGVIRTDATNILQLTNAAEDVVSFAGNGRYVDGPMRKYITSGNFNFPVGDAGRYGEASVLATPLTGYWELEYYNSNSYDPLALDANLKVASNNEYWRIKAPGATSLTKIQIRWDNQSGMPANDAASIASIRIAEWSASKWNQLDGSNLASGNQTYGTVTSVGTHPTFNAFTDGNYFTLSSTRPPVTYNWTGATSTDWNVGSNWSGGAVPSAVNDVTIDDKANDPIITIAAECRAINITNGTLIIAANGSLSAHGNMLNTGTFILESPAGNGSSASFINYGTITGNAQVKRYIVSGQSHYVSSPIQCPAEDGASNAKSSLFTALGSSYNPNFHWYDEAADLFAGTPPETNNTTLLTPGWKYMQEFSTDLVRNMEKNKGYSFYTDVSGNITFNGKLNTGDMSINTLKYTPNDPTIGVPRFFDGWNLVGNPYPSGIDWDRVSTGLNNVDNAIYVWDGASAKYNSYIGGTGQYVNGQTNIIAPMQGFFVHSTADGGFTLNNSHRVHPNNTGTNTTLFYSVVNGKKVNFTSTRTINNSNGKSNIYDLIKLKAQAGGKSDETEVYFHTNASGEYDGKYDAFTKFSWDETYPGYYNREDIPNLYSLTKEAKVALAISALPDTNKNNLVIPLGVRLGTSGVVTISKTELKMDNTNVYLVDKLDNKTTYLNNTDKYTFNFTAGDVRDRFELRFKKNNAPVAGNIANKQYNENESFNFTLPVNTFTEIDEGDEIVSYTATLSNGNPLPAWLTFNAGTRTFTGNPGNNDQGSIFIKLNARDIPGAFGTTSFELSIQNINNAPTLLNAIADKSVNEDEIYSYSLPVNTFNDIDLSDALTYSALLSNGNPLPNWLTFNPSSRTFAGKPGNNDVGTVSIKVTASDNFNATVSDEFTLSVVNINNTPELANLISNQTVNEGVAYNFVIPANTFTDIDAGDILTYSVNIPSWMQFNPVTASLSGTPTRNNVGKHIITVTATDKALATASTQYSVDVIFVNNAPALTQLISDQTVNEGSDYNFAIPSNTFSDLDASDVLTYTAVVPAWMQFNATTGKFSGIPANKDVGSYSITVTATDKSMASISTKYTVEVLNVNNAPELAIAISDQSVNEKSVYSFVLPANTFTDIDAGDVLKYNADVPSWMKFNAATGTFSGTPTNNEVGLYTIKITATDKSSASISSIFVLNVLNVNDAPLLNSSISDQQIDEKAWYEYTIDQNMFNDIDLGDQLTLSAKLADGSSLPSWLSFDASNRKLSGSAANPADYNITITATDKAGATISDEYMLTVKKVTGLDDLDMLEVKIYPNPSQGLFFVQTTNLGTNLNLIVRDYNGRTIKEQKVTGNKNEIHLDNFADGIYFIEVTDGVNHKVYKVMLKK